MDGVAAPPARLSFEFDLGPSPGGTYTRRECKWIPGGTDRDGTLQLFLSAAKTTRGGWDCRDYAVQEQSRVGGHEPGRVFRVVEDEDETGESVYEVFLADRTATDAAGAATHPWDSCDCKAGQFRLKCKHVGGLRLVVTKGVYHGGKSC